jgi:voltage-gated potassium channel
VRNPLHWRRGTVLGTALMAVVVIGIVGYLLFGYSVPDAISSTLLTLTTVGFATSRDLPPAVELFTAGLAVLGVSLFAVILGVAGTAIVEGSFGTLSRTRRMHARIDRLSNHFIVCAYGRVGHAIARELEAEGVPFVVVDIKAELEPQMQHDGVAYLIANPTSEEVLREAGIDRARGLICAVDNDAENVYITIVARSLSPTLQIVARAAEEQSADRLYRAGATSVVSPYVTSGRRMAHLALRPHVVEFFDLGRAGGADVRLEELAITADSHMPGRTVEEVIGQATPVLLRRDDGQLIANPNRQLRLRAGDVIVLYGKPETLRPLNTS